MVAERSSQDCFTQSAGLLYAVRKIAKRSPQHCFTQSAGLLSAVRRVAERSPHCCQAQSAGLLSAVCRVAERSRSNTAFQLPRFTFSTGPFDSACASLRDPTTQRSLHAVLNSFDFIFRNVCRRIALRSPCNPCDTPPWSICNRSDV